MGVGWCCWGDVVDVVVGVVTDGGLDDCVVGGSGKDLGGGGEPDGGDGVFDDRLGLG